MKHNYFLFRRVTLPLTRLEAQSFWMMLLTALLVFPAFVANAQISSNNPVATYSTIQSAINGSNDGAVILISAGTYSEAITVNKAITLNGPNAGTLGNGTRVAEAILSNGSINVSSAGPVIIDGFHIYQTNDTPGDVILLGGNSTVTVRNSKIERAGPGTAPGVSVRAITTSSGNGVKTIQGNLFTGSTAGGLFGNHTTWNSALYINGSASTVNITNNRFENVRSAINLDDFNENIAVSGNTFTNDGTYLSFGGSTPTGGAYTLGANEFATPVSGFINLSNVSNTFRLDITSSTLNGNPFSGYSLANLFLLETTIAHRGRIVSGTPRNGLVTYVAGNQYVVSGTTTIQSAVDYGTSGDIINVKDGTYNEEVTVNKSLTIKGANAGTAGNATRTTESILTGNNGAHGGFIVTASNVTIDGFTITGAAGTYEAGVYSSPMTSGLTLQNNIITDNIIGAYPSSNGASSVKRNLFTGNNRAGSAGGAGIYVEATNSLTIEENEFTEHTNNSAVIFGATATNAHRNLVFTKNYIHTNNSANSMVYLNGVSNSTISYNTVVESGTTAIKVAGGNANISLINNLLDGSATSIKVQNEAIGPNTGIQIHNNSLVSTKSIDNLDVATVDATCNWYGSNVAGDVAAKVSGPVTYQPFSNNGTDNNGPVVGFEPVLNSCVYPVRNLTHPKDFGTIQAAINDAITEPGDLIQIDAGTYNENITVSKSLTFVGANKDICGTASRSAETILVAPSTQTGVITLSGSVTATFNGVLIDGVGVAYLTQPNQGITFKNSVFELDFIPGANNLYAASSGLLLDCNYFKAIAGTNDGSSSHIFVGDGTFTAINNTFTSESAINSLNASTTSLPVWLNITANTSNFLVQNNLFTKIDIGILLGANAGNGSIQNNDFSEAKRAAYTSGSSYGTGIALFGNYTPSGPVVIQKNKFYNGETGIRTSTGDATNSFPAPNLLTISNNSFVDLPFGSFRIGSAYNGSTNKLNATCNWFSNAPVITGAANINYIPQLASGTDDDPALGFQQSMPMCTAPQQLWVNDNDGVNILTTAPGNDANPGTQALPLRTINYAISVAGTGATIFVDAGTYNENVDVNKTLTIEGQSAANVILTPTTPNSGVGIAINAADVAIKKVTVNQYQYGIDLNASGTAHKLLDLKATNNSLNGISVRYGAGPEAAAITGLEINNVQATGNGEAGLLVFATVTGSKVFDNVVIKNSDFSNNAKKGIYLERANNLTIDNVTINNSGTDASNGNNNNGIDINLKYAIYSGITIKNSTITNSGVTGTGGDPANPAAIAIKARRDNSYATNLATLSNVLIENNTISGPQNGIRIGEPNQTNDGTSGVTIQKNNLSANFANKALINRTAANVTLICNYFGTNTDYANIVTKLAAAGTGKNLLTSVATNTTFTTCISPTGFALSTSTPEVCAGSPSFILATGLLPSTLTTVSFNVNNASTETFTGTTTGAGGLLIDKTLPAGSYTFTVTSVEANNTLSSVNPPMSVTFVVKANVVAGTVSGASPINVGATTTYTSTGTPGGTWSSSNPSVATVNSSGLVTGVASGTANIIYTVSGCGGTVSSQANITVQLVPDLSPVITVSPTSMYGNTNFTIKIDVTEINSAPTSGTVVVLVTKQSKYTLTLSSAPQNSIWTLNSTSNENYYVLTTTSSIPAGEALTIRLNGYLTPQGTAGTLSISAVVVAGSGGETRINNNIDVDRIETFPQ